MNDSVFDDAEAERPVIFREAERIAKLFVQGMARRGGQFAAGGAQMIANRYGNSAINKLDLLALQAAGAAAIHHARGGQYVSPS